MVWAAMVGDKELQDNSMTYWDTHANMMIIEVKSEMIHQFDNNVEVRHLSNKCSKLEHVSIFDAGFSYDCYHIIKIYLKIIRNVLYVTHTCHNLVPNGSRRHFTLKSHLLLDNFILF